MRVQKILDCAVFYSCIVYGSRRHVEGEDTWVDIAKNREVWTDVVYELFHNANDY